jgi:hypothetical protein
MLLQCYSKLYHYLSIYESDNKRLLAMKTRRIDLLETIIYTIKKSAFEALHKELSYEIGEIYLALLDIKLSKFRNRIQPSNSSMEWDIDIRQLKSSEIEKCNGYCKASLAMFSHFTRLYSNEKAMDDGPIPMKSWSLRQLMTASCQSPSYDRLTREEIRPYLNAHFFIARTLSKVILPSNMTSSSAGEMHPVEPIEVCLKKYQWLVKFIPQVAEVKGMSVEEIPYHEEYRICEEMASLLPSKIYRMKVQGEGGLKL